jgi:TldD protein
MPQIEEIANDINKLFKKHRADYIEVHVEESQTSSIGYRGRVLESIGKNSATGGNVRALVKGGWGFVSFNDLSDLDRRIGQAVEQAWLAGKSTSYLADVAPVCDTVRIEPAHNPQSITLQRKKELLDRYNDIIWSAPSLQTSVISYGDALKKIIFVNSEGAFLVQERGDIALNLSAVASNDKDVQQSHISTGSPGDFSVIEDMDDRIAEMAGKASSLLAAPQAQGGEYTVVLDPVLAGVFVHEAFGHLSEADHVYENEQLRGIMELGRRFGSDELNIVDGAAVPNLRGSYKYDDEGVPSSKTYLIKNGILTGRLHSRETAAKMGEKPTGNARAINYLFPPIVRMTNTYIEPGETKFDDIWGYYQHGNVHFFRRRILHDKRRQNR